MMIDIQKFPGDIMHFIVTIIPTVLRIDADGFVCLTAEYAKGHFQLRETGHIIDFYTSQWFRDYTWYFNRAPPPRWERIYHKHSRLAVRYKHFETWLGCNEHLRLLRGRRLRLHTVLCCQNESDIENSTS